MEIKAQREKTLCPFTDAIGIHMLKLRDDYFWKVSSYMEIAKFINDNFKDYR